MAWKDFSEIHYKQEACTSSRCARSKASSFWHGRQETLSRTTLKRMAIQNSESLHCSNRSWQTWQVSNVSTKLNFITELLACAKSSVTILSSNPKLRDYNFSMASLQMIWQILLGLSISCKNIKESNRRHWMQNLNKREKKTEKRERSVSKHKLNLIFDWCSTSWSWGHN